MIKIERDKLVILRKIWKKMTLVIINLLFSAFRNGESYFICLLNKGMMFLVSGK
jgi:hypothetical protein